MFSVEARIFTDGKVAGLVTALLLASGGCREDSGDVAESDSRTSEIAAFTDIPKLATNTFTRAMVCGTCHQAIHAHWQQSLHARSFSNGVFQAAYRSATEAYSPERSRLCLKCHAPTVQKTQDYAAETRMTKEGVTCDFCHSIRDVHLDTPEKGIDLNVGETKYGPLRHAQSPAHKVVHSELHLRARLCAACHEYRNQHGVPILETYSEWRASSYAKLGAQCQNCHMQPLAGRVAPWGMKDTEHEEVNLHNISGSHNSEQVRKAVTMEVLNVERVGGKNVLVRISVHNTGAGHCFPTGLPKHRAVLEVSLMDGDRLVARRTIEFAKVLLNNKGMPITNEEEMFLEARSIRSDTRLKPEEERIVTVTFHNAEMPGGQIEASLWYQYSTRTVKLKDGVEGIEPTEVKFVLASQKRPLPKAGR